MDAIKNAAVKAAAAAASGGDFDEEESLKEIEEMLKAEDGLDVPESVPVQQPSDVMDDGAEKEPVDERERDGGKIIDPNMTDEQLMEREQALGTKTSQDGEFHEKDEKGKRYDAPSKDGKVNDAIGGSVTKNGRLYHYEGSLGTFDYDPSEWAVGVKDVTYENGASGMIPVLRYLKRDNVKLGTKVKSALFVGIKDNPELSGLDGNHIKIPDGVKSLDYTFEGIKELETVPVIPDSVESAHGAFKDCTNLTRFCSNAKENVSEGSVDLWETVKSGGIGGIVGAAGGTVAWGVASLATEGLTLTALPAFITGGSMLGATVTGGKKVVETKAETNGKGGQAACPKNLKDMSNMFENCKALTETYASSDSVLNEFECYMGCEQLGEDSYANKHGAASFMDVSESNMPKEGSYRAYEGANIEAIAQGEGKSYSKYWDEDTKTLQNPNASAEEKQMVEDLEKVIAKEHADLNIAETTLSKDSDGLAHNGRVMTKEGMKDTQNIQDKNYHSPQELLTNNFGSFLDRALVSLGEYKIIKMLTGSRMVGAVATFGLQTIGLLPKSLKPVVDGVANMLGKDSAVGKVLTGFSGMLGDGGSDKNKDSKAYVTSGNGTGVTEQTAGADVQSSGINPNQLWDQMSAAGENVAKSGDLLDKASVQDVTKDADLVQMEAMMVTTAGGFADRLESSKDAEGKVSDTVKQQTATDLMTLLEGMDRYQASASKTIASEYAGDSLKQDQAASGLSKVLSVSCDPVLSTAKELDEKHGIFTEEQRERIDALTKQFAGKADTTLNYEDDEAMFGDAYLSDPEDLPKASDSKAVQKAVVKTVPAKQASSGKDRGKLAEEMAQRVGGFASEGVSSEADYEF